MKILRYLVIVFLLVSVIAAIGCQYLPANSPAQLKVHFINVGQADSILVQYGSSSMIIDAGGNSTAKSLASTIKNMGISKFDVVVATHPHEDHIGGLDTVINQFGIGKIYMPKVTTTTDTFLDVLKAIKDKGLTVTNPAPGTAFNLGEAQATMLAPNSSSYENLNNYSIVIKLVYSNTSFLLTGDAQAESEKEMLSKGYSLKSDVLKVAHHGSESSTTLEFLKAVSPRYGVIPVGQGNDYGHPHQVTLNRLVSAGVKVYRTDLNGTITFSSDGSNLTISTEK